jgi:DNA modification methylase
MSSVPAKIRSKVKRKKDPDKTIGNLATPAIEMSPTTAADLRSSGYNPRTITPQKLEMLNAAMKEFGDLGGVVFNRTTGRLVSGHQRGKNLDSSWPITKEEHTDNTGTVAIGYIETPDGRFSYREVAWDESKERAANIAANQHGGEFDDDLLAQLLQALNDSGYDMALTGFDDAELKALLAANREDPLGNEDAEVEPVENPFVKRGDLWILGGEHRLLCGDSTKMEDVDRLLQGEKADLVVTDPPYNVAYESKAGKIENDNMSTAAFEQFLLSVFAMLNHALKPGGCFYIYHAEGNGIGGVFRSAVDDTPGLNMKQCLVWVKNAMVLSRQDYSWRHEPILYGWKEGAAHYYDGDFTRSTVIDDDIDISKMDKKALQNLISDMRNKQPSTVIRVDKPGNSEWHPTTKPVRLFEKNVYASSRPGETVLDLFSGSGTTIITCRKTSRKGRGMEYDPKYAQASLQRYFEYCGEQPMLLEVDGKLVPFTQVEKKRKKIGKTPNIECTSAD